MSGPLVIDGSQGEGGGQILRTALSLAAIKGRGIRIENIRAGRPKPGLAAQHVTAVRAVAALCRARVTGDEIGSGRLDFTPEAAVQAGEYAFDVSAARKGGSAGATSLVLQTVLLPLALARGESRLVLQGGTHVAWSPPFDYLRDVWLPALARMGIVARIELRRSGWYPVGGGEVWATVSGADPGDRQGLKPLTVIERGELRRVTGRSMAANLPRPIAQRMASRAQDLLSEAGFDVSVEAERVSAACAGAGIFLTAHYEAIECGFNAIGARGIPAEAVATDAVEALVAHHCSGAALDFHLADQILLPQCLANGPSAFTVERLTGHLKTNARVVELFGTAEVAFEPAQVGGISVKVMPLRK